MKTINKKFAVPVLKVKDTTTHVDPTKPLDLNALVRQSKNKKPPTKTAA